MLAKTNLKNMGKTMHELQHIRIYKRSTACSQMRRNGKSEHTKEHSGFLQWLPLFFFRTQYYRFCFLVVNRLFA